MSATFKRTSYSHYLVGLIAVLMPIHFEAQIENIPINEEVIIDKLYVGLLSNPSFSQRTSNDNSSSSVQFGTRVSLILIPEKIRLRSFGVFKITEKGIQIFRSYETIVRPNKKMAIHFGIMATPTTEMRPNPATWQSQIETNAEKTIIGGRPGIKLNYSFNTNFSLSYGIHNHNNKLGQHLKVRYKQLTFSSFVEHETQFFAAKWKFEQGNLLITNSKDRIAFSNVITMSSDYKIYTDVEFSTLTKKHTFFDFGLRRFFSSDTFNGFLSISYNDQSKIIQGGLFIHI